MDEIAKSYVKQTAALLGVNSQSLRYLIEKHDLKNNKKEDLNRPEAENQHFESRRDS